MKTATPQSPTREYLVRMGLIKSSNPVQKPVLPEPHYTPQHTLTVDQIDTRVNKALNYLNATVDKRYTTTYSDEYLRQKDLQLERRAFQGANHTDVKLRSFGY